MAGVFRVGLLRVLSINSTNKLLANRSELIVPIRTISGKNARAIAPPTNKPKPWPYKTKGYNIFNSLYDKTTSRFDENSKIIVVEGPIAAGKTKLAKELAAELDMLYLPEANLDMLTTNIYGFNLKKLNDQIPESLRFYDIPDFLLNPRHKMTACFQMRQYVAKFSQYIDALAHVFSTGQGVILDRCVYSDFVFMESMFKLKYISPEARSIYYDARSCSIDELLRPHLIIYLDIPVEKVMANVQKRNYTCEKDSEVINPKYLKSMEDLYKLEYLKKLSTHSELLIYDWSEQGDIEVVVEDIERIDFSRIDEQDAKVKDWVYHLEEEYGCLRNKYADKKNQLMMYLNIPRFDAPELLADGQDFLTYSELVLNSPGNAYETGFNPAMGDNVLFRVRDYPNCETLPLIERSLS
ncbi:hypothetical protein PPYR_08008 [Photinus pyralis]|uniref:NADH dehydrogenase [ubiquinone] 1 alpha subcomplex subunit 10, mitochondrial n=1 Tax=Photinus pyralis TaxID=7054 RepID=A0A5N4ASD0_PHOPY|nr:NADH dehydrogenase [ubiquinone] 1 alpha subcomplex subunit 10, mitochondrial [Photinus pyralis]KAB0800128.1 hypothetical protein PPYR_08008 [Photinus pyralis]